ncbi:MAG: hypothetical protein JWM80_3638 [Cyanobacteria bacterium RYN_339]|nr:hypothetical protein [Cyanobacteria bacterium RYN_339]
MSEALGRRRLLVGALFSAAMLAAYFGFVLLVAFYKDFMKVLVVPGLSVGIAGGVLVILFAWLLTGLYVRWANGPFDEAVQRLREQP